EGQLPRSPECEQACEGSEGVISLLTFWTPPTTAQPIIETMPPFAAEGTDVLLLARDVPENPLGYAWHRGERVDNNQLITSYRVDTNLTAKGPAYSGRETIYPNGTLLIQNVTQKDTGSYILLVTKVDLQTEGQTGYLSVLPTPIITSNNSNPWEHEDTVVLTCGAETQSTSYTWWINSQSLPSSTRLELSKDKRTLTVVTVTRNDAGPYVCEARNPELPFPLIAPNGPDTPPPFPLRLLLLSRGNLNLSCHTASNPATPCSRLANVRPSNMPRFSVSPVITCTLRSYIPCLAWMAPQSENQGSQG
uniref:Ig-like domain-containing protein n=1 Tax=Moschus moschiferus TaxID=68415 RepID=A0A8C6DZ97_MOSMO